MENTDFNDYLEEKIDINKLNERDKRKILLASDKYYIKLLFEQLEQKEMYSFSKRPYKDANNNDKDIELYENFLYHGIKESNIYLSNPLDRLESIFYDKMILANKYQKRPAEGSNICNGESYISLTSLRKNMNSPYNYTYNIFVKPNISLVIRPEVDAIKAIWTSEDIVEYAKTIKDEKSVKNRYSTLSYEYQVKDKIPISMVIAVGFPYKFYSCYNNTESVNSLLDELINLILKYEFNMSIVDTSNYNKILKK